MARNYKNKRGKKRPGWKKHAKAALSVAKKAAIAYLLVKRLAASNNIEYKFKDDSFLAQATNYTGNIYPICLPTQGITDTQRIGDSIKIQNVTARIIVNGNATVPSVVRCIMFTDKQNAISATNEVLSGAGSAFAPISGKQYDYRFKTKILWDRSFNCDPVKQNQYVVDTVVPVHMHQQFTGGTTTVETGALKFLSISNVNASTPAVTVNFRSTFTDN